MWNHERSRVGLAMGALLGSVLLGACAVEISPRAPALCDSGLDCADAQVAPGLDASEFDASEFDASEFDASEFEDAGVDDASPDAEEAFDGAVVEDMDVRTDGEAPDADGPDGGDADAAVSDAAMPDADLGFDAGEADAGEADAGPPACTWSDYGDGITGGQVNWVGFDPVESGRIWATTPTQILRVNPGGSWEEVGRPDRSLLTVALPQDDLPMIAATAEGLRRSDDGGMTWRVGALGGLAISSVVRSPADPRVLFATTSGGGFFISTDGGNTWRSAGFGLSPSAVLAVAPDPRDSREVVAGGPYLNATGGWSDTGFIARSADGGLTYTVVYSEIGRTQALARCDANPDVLISAHVYGLARSRDGGRTFTRVAPSVFGNSGPAAVTGAACDIVYAVRRGQGVMRSRDGGDTWTGPLRNGMTLVPGQSPGTLSVDPSNPEHVLAASNGGLFETFDGGDNWTPVSGVGVPILRSIQRSDVDPAVLWMATAGLGAWVRVPGASWNFVAGIPRDFVNSVREDVAGRVFSMGYRSTDRVTFTNPGPMGNVFDVATDPRDRDRVWAVTQTLGIWRSTNGGVTFTAANGGLSPWVTPVGTFIDTRSVLVTPGALIVGTHGRGIARSVDDGATFDIVPALDARRITCLASLGAVGVVACVADAGFFLSVDEGQTWTPWNEGFPSLDVGGIVQDPGTGNVYATGVGRIWIRGAERWEPFDPECTPVNPGSLAVQDDADGRRYLVATVPGSLVVRRPI
jgi:photosystem II stability/assembly factor-like uncharacterized protein